MVLASILIILVLALGYSRIVTRDWDCNVMSELSRLAGKYSIERELYQPAVGLGKVRELIASSRYRRFVVKNKDIPLGYQEEWDRIAQVLQVEFSDTQRLLIAEKSSQPLVSTMFKPEMPFEEESENYSFIKF